MIAGIKKLLILAVIFAIGFGSYVYTTTEKKVKYNFTTADVTRGDITATVTATGELNALDVVSVGTQVSGRIEKLYADFNSVVDAGQLIAVIDPSVQRLDLRQYEAALAVSQASLQSAQASLKDSEKKLKRNRELFERKLIARSEFDTSGTEVDVRRAAVQEARSKVNQARAQVERARTNLGYTNIYSPISGVVIDRQVDEGQTVAASYQTPTIFKIAKDLTQMKIATKVDEADIGTVEEGQDVTFRVDAFPEENFSGKVTQVRIAPTTADSVVTYTVIISVSNADLKLKPGMTANVSIQTRQSKNTIRIPVTALRFTPDEKLLDAISFDKSLLSEKKGLNQATVWTEKNGKLDRAIDIVTGISDNRWAQLVKGDISDGTKLVINAQVAK